MNPVSKNLTAHWTRWDETNAVIQRGARRQRGVDR